MYGSNNTGLVPSQPSPNLPQGGWAGANYLNSPQYNTPWPQNYNRQSMAQGTPVQQNNQAMPAQCINNVIQVMGPESALNYQVGPNSMVVMMDSNRPVFYLKKSDDSGYSETKAFEFHEIPLMDKPIDVSPQSDDSNAVTKEDIEEIKKQLNRRDTVSKKDFDALKKMIEGLGANHG